MFGREVEVRPLGEGDDGESALEQAIHADQFEEWIRAETVAIRRQQREQREAVIRRELEALQREVEEVPQGEITSGDERLATGGTGTWIMQDGSTRYDYGPNVNSRATLDDDEFIQRGIHWISSDEEEGTGFWLWPDGRRTREIPTSADEVIHVPADLAARLRDWHGRDIQSARSSAAASSPATALPLAAA